MQGIKGMRGIVYLAVLALAGCSYGADALKEGDKIQDLVKLAPGWNGEVIAKVDQSFAGWSVAIGDADNDGKNEILTTGSPDSRLEFYKKVNGKWQWKTLAKNLAEETPGMGLTVKIVDLNGDGANEIILGTGQDAKLTCAKFYILQTDGSEITKKISSSSFLNGSAYTHNFGVYDIDGDGVKEVLTAYCGSGEVTRYDVNKELTAIERKHLTTHPGSGEDAMIADVDNDGKMEFITCDSFRKDAAKVKIFEFDAKGELVMPARVVLAGYDGKPCFHCNVEVGDVDNDGKNDLIICWKRQELPNQGTILAYTISASGVATPKYTLLHEDPNLDLSYCERQMIVADADNDGKNDLVVTTRGEKEWGGRGLGNVFLFKIEKGKVQKTLLADFFDDKADSLWPAVGDADNDGKNEIVIATGAGSRRKPGISYVVMIKKDADSIFTIDSKSEVVIGETLFPVERTAASELQKYLENMFDSPVAERKELKDGVSVVLGTPESSSIVNSLKEQLNIDAIKNDGYVISPAEYKGKRILVIAANEPRGVLYGVYGIVREAGVLLRGDNDFIPKRENFQISRSIRSEPFFKYRAGGIIDAILNFWEDIPTEHLETMWKWYAQNGQNMFVYHSMAGNYPDNPELNAFLGTCLGSYIYFEDYPLLQWKQRNGKIVGKARNYLDYLIKSGQKWGVDIVLSVYEPGYPDGLLAEYPHIKGKHYPCAANDEFWKYLESEYRELFKAFPDLKGVIFTTGENSRGDIINATCDLCCGTKWEDKDNWKIKQWQRPALVCKHIRDAVKSVKPDALVIFRPHLLDMTLGNIVQAVRWDPNKSNPLMQKAMPDDVAIIRRPHDHDFISNAGHNQFLGAGLGRQPEGMLSLCGGEYRGKHSIPCAEIEEFGRGKARIPHFAAKGVDFLNVNLSFYLPGWTGPSGCLGIDMMNEQQVAQLVWSPSKDVNSIWMDWAKTYFPGAENEMIAIMRPSYEMMYLMGYTAGDVYLQSTRFSFPQRFQRPQQVSQKTIETFEKAYQISNTMYENFLPLREKIASDDYEKIKKYLLENKKFCAFWLNYVKANYYYHNYDQQQLTKAVRSLHDIAPAMDFQPCPWLDVWRDCITAPISYQENGTKFIAAASGKLPGKPDYAYPIVDLYKYENHHLDEGKAKASPYITAMLIDYGGSGIDFNSVDIALDGNSVSRSQYSIVKNMLLSNPSFERGLKEYSDEWIPSVKNKATVYSSVRKGDGTEHSGKDCLMIRAIGGTNFWKLEKPLSVKPANAYTFSCWIKTKDIKNGGAYISAVEYDKGGKVAAEHKGKILSEVAMDWINSDCSFTTAAVTEKVVLKLNFDGYGEVWFDDVIFAALSDPVDRHLVIYQPEKAISGRHVVTFNIKDKAGNKSPDAMVIFEICR